MRKRRLAMKPLNLILLFLAGLPMYSQPNTQGPIKPAEPEYIGVFAALAPSTGALIELERRNTTQHTRVKGLGFAGGEAYLEIPGERSPVRFKEGAVPAFVVKAASQQNDPQSSIRFITWRSGKGARQITVGKVGAFGIGAKVGADENLLQFNATRFGETSFKIVPAQPLPPGEYALGPPGGHDSFSFGVDPSEGEKTVGPAPAEAAASSQSVAKPEAVVETKGPAPERPLTDDDVIGMVKAGLGNELTIAKIKQAPAVDLDVSADALIRLKKAGASKLVIDAMMKRASQRRGK